MKHFVTLSDLSGREIEKILADASKVKSARGSSHKKTAPLQGKSVALLFEKPSLRTRVTFEVAITDLGGHPIYLGPNEIGLGKRESVSDISRNLSRWIHAMVARTYKHATAVELARTSSVPVINALTDREHPCQAMGDLLTILERRGRLKGVTLTFVGDGNNVCHSLMQAAAKTGMHMRVACPDGYEPGPEVVEESRQDASKSGGSVAIVHNPVSAVRDADVVYTDVWVSMGFEAEEAKRRKDFAGFQVNAGLMSNAKSSAIFMHCLPARRGDEVTDEVMDGRQSAILDQAENRLHSAKAILLAVLAPPEEKKERKTKRRSRS